MQDINFHGPFNFHGQDLLFSLTATIQTTNLVFRLVTSTAWLAIFTFLFPNFGLGTELFRQIFIIHKPLPFVLDDRCSKKEEEGGKNVFRILLHIRAGQGRWFAVMRTDLFPAFDTLT